MNIYKKLIKIGNEKQKSLSFDKATLVKIFKGAMISATGAFALYVLNFVGSMEFTNIHLASLVAFGIPFLVNLVKEFMKGTK